MFTWQIDNRIRLELLEARHGKELFRLTEQNRKYLGQWLPWVESVQEPEDTAQFIKKSQQQWIENQSFQAVINAGDKVAGIVGHHKIDWQNQKTSLGYWLGKSYQGRGIMTKCCAAIVQHAFKVLDLHRVEIHCAIDNKKSRAIPERLGFIKEVIQKEAIQLNGTFKDLVVYRALSSEWECDI
ncbi:GNAT family N-acetyltransferase [Fodinibius sp. SL11]|uniref:GNAT family N-acetyltransferase n=1 Tax=Fodinibius sp. SL11 TaxID=3425690 RepID=UPI003F885021